MGNEIIEWSSAFEIGIDSVDKQHSKLVSLLNDVYIAAVELRGQEAILKVLRGMAEYTKEHFSFEEGLMKESNYPELKAHMAMHLAFVEFVEKTIKRFEMDDFVSSVELITFLFDWLKNHILNADKQFSNYYNKKGN